MSRSSNSSTKYPDISAHDASHQKSISQYLDQYSEEEARKISPLCPSDKHYHRCIVIPVYNESTDCIDRILNSALSEEPLLLIIVINQPDNDSNISKNSKFWQWCIETFKPLKQSENSQWLSTNFHTDLLLVDRFHHRLPQKQGVGLARKIGTDIALQLIMRGCLISDWIHHTDADTHLPDHYFDGFDQSLQQQPHASAGLYTYQHDTYQHGAQNNDSQYSRINTATALYESSLHHYVDGLREAGSPYSFHTLGSCLVVHSVYYAKVRGFPKRAAGEDFYLINKLSKLAPVITIDSVTLSIEARLSDRVPFGTGPAVSRIMEMTHPEQDFLYYHPSCFDELKALLEQFNTLFSYKPTSLNDNKDISYYGPWLNTFSLELQQSLSSIKIDTLFTHINQNIQSHEQCLHHAHLWLDAFKTLKLIHALEQYYPKQKRECLLQSMRSRNKTSNNN